MSVMVATRRKERRNSAKETTGVTTRTSITSGVEKSRWVSQNRQYAPGTSETSVNWHSEGQNEERRTLTGSRLRVLRSLASTGQASTTTEFFLFELDQPLHQYRYATVFNVACHDPRRVKYTSFWVLWNGKDFEKNADEERLRELPELWQAAYTRLEEITINKLLFG